jgi:hypothetical protein
MSGPVLLVYGHRLRPLDTVARIGVVLGLERSTAFRAADRDDWPRAGEGSHRLIVASALMDRLGIPYSIEAEAAAVRPCDGSKS